MCFGKESMTTVCSDWNTGVDTVSKLYVNVHLPATFLGTPVQLLCNTNC